MRLASARLIPASDHAHSIRGTHWKVRERVRLGYILPIPWQDMIPSLGARDFRAALERGSGGIITQNSECTSRAQPEIAIATKTLPPSASIQ
ncbi:MAG TPA: hypothetical protein VFZ43_02865 [Anaerolineales bacterium]